MDVGRELRGVYVVVWGIELFVICGGLVIPTPVILNGGDIYALPSLKEGNVCACVREFLNAINMECIAFINAPHGCATYQWST